MNDPSKNSVRFAFWGSSRFSTIVLDELSRIGLIPAYVITTPDKPQGRGLALSPTSVKEWALEKKIPVYDPAKLDAAFVEAIKKEKCDIFVVASYGKIIPEAIIDLPARKTLNIHPSLLPKYRGASPLQSAMLDDAKETGVTIMRIDREMDHGPIVAQKPVAMNEWPVYEDFEETMARAGSRLLAEILSKWVAGEITEREQDHSAATYTKKIVKGDALLDLSGDPYLNFRKIQAYHEWPRAYFIAERGGKKIQVKITHASFVNGRLDIEKVIPESGKEMDYEDFLRGNSGTFPSELPRAS